MAIESIAKTLGSGSGIDVTSLVTQLVDAQFAAKTATLTKRDETLKAQISAVSEIKSSISGFDTALKSLIQTGSLKTQPSSSNTNIVKATALSSASAAGLSANVEVRQLASAQTAFAEPVANAATAIGTGKLTLTFGTATVVDGDMTAFTAGGGTPVEIMIGTSNSSLTGIAAAINAKNAGVTASVLSDAGGARLVLKSATGASQAFTLTATEDVGAEGLAAFDIGVGATGTTVSTAAQDAIVAVDGVPVNRLSNTIIDLIPGVRLDLVSASVGTKVALGNEAPTAALSQAVNDVVDTYNELLASLKAATDPVTGVLKTDPAARTLLRSLQTLTTANLVPGAAANTPATLAAIGVATDRSGVLSLDTAKLNSALQNHGGNVEAMFRAGAGLSAALNTISFAATSTVHGLGASATRYTAAQTSLARDQEKATSDAETLRTRMTRQFATMDSIVSRYKSTQTALQNQIDAWNSQD